MRRESFLNYRNYIWLWFSLLMVCVLAFIYWAYPPIGGHRGSTTYGYTVGVIATVFIALLMWFGVRKRSYRAYRTTLRAWLSSHVWIGISLLIIVPLHAGFQYGTNVHTLAYLFMVGVILTGLVGVYFYQALPEETLSNRGGGSLKILQEKYESVTQEIQREAERSPEFAQVVKKFGEIKVLSSIMILYGKRNGPLTHTQVSRIMGDVTAGRLSEHEKKALSQITKQREYAYNIENEKAALIKLRLWLFVHVPLSFGLLIALVVHIISVFYYWS
jgi:hypothetical protein